MLETTDLRSAVDAGRRAIERDLHDGTQQHLVALAVKLRLIQRTAEADLPRALRLLDEACADVLATVEEVRAVGQGNRPPLLVERGLVAALRTVGARASVPVTVRTAPIPCLGPDVEAAIYFCCVEALQNAVKHAGTGATVEVSLVVEDDRLRFQVSDDGVGFDVDSCATGHGLGNISARTAAVGGSMALTSTLGRGTTITGWVPVPSRP